MNRFFFCAAVGAVTLAMSSAVSSTVSAQQNPKPGPSMPGMDMPAMMKQCDQMRQQMQPGARVTPEMRQMMQQCDQMDTQMGGTSGTDAAPRPRTR